MNFKGDYGIAKTIGFGLFDDTGADLTTAPSFAAGDCLIIKDEGTSANTTNLPTSEGNGRYSLVLTATEMQAARIHIVLDDQSSPDIWMPVDFWVSTEVTVGEYGGGVWFDGDSGATGTTVGVHGTPLRPVNVFADAVTLAGSGGTKLYKIFHLGGLSSTTVSSTMTGIEVIRVGSAEQRELLFSGSPTVGEARFDNVSMTGATGSGTFTADRCIMAMTIGGAVSARDCELKGSIELGSSTQCRFFGCHTQSSVDIDFTTNSSDAVFRRFSGVLLLINMDGTNAADIEGTGDITIDATCSGGVVNIRGDFSVTDNSAGAVTINTTAAGVNVTQINGSTSNVTSLVGALEPLEDLTVTGVTDSTTFTATAAISTTDNSYQERAIIFKKTTTTVALRGRATAVITYTGATKTFVVDTLNATPQVGDTFTLRP